MLHTYHLQQSKTGEGGLCCLALCAWLLGDRVDLRSLRAQHPISASGPNSRELMSIAQAMGMIARPVRCEPETLKTLPRPTILQWGAHGFVVLDRVLRSGRARIFDPAVGWRVAEAREIDQKLAGVAIEIVRASGFEPRKERPKLSAAALLRWSPALSGSATQAIIVSAFLQLYVLVSPLYMRVVVDEVVAKGDGQLLNVVAAAFALFAVFNASAMVLRAVAVQQLNVLLSWDMTRRVFHHMIRLPLSWFQSRKLGDTLGRLQSLDQVRSVLANGLAAVIDGVMSIATLVMLTVIAPLLAAIAVAGFALYVGVRLIAIPVILHFNNRAIVAATDEQGKRIETLRVIQTIKVMAAEAYRENYWAQRFAETLQTAQNNILAANYFSSVQIFVGSLVSVAVIYFGARQILAGEMTIGLLTAAVAYQNQFTQRASSLFEQFVGWKMLDIHLARLSEVVLEPVEPGHTPARATHAAPTGGALELRDIVFRYGGGERLVIDGASIKVERGEHVAIVGASGSGKSTLVKLMCGLYVPASGEVLVDGKRLDHWGVQVVRRSLGVVLQEDELLAGSIADNVAFFDEQVDIDRVWRCLLSAGIAAEVEAMPSRVETLIGDMGSSLSGGQKQRLLIARALYRRPRIMILDEATSHLDVAREKQVVAALSELSVTRIVVAHRPETVRAADRIVVLRNGRLESATTAQALDGVN